MMNETPYYITPSPQSKVVCFGCLCEANPTIALEVIRTAMAEQEEVERWIREDEEKFCKYYREGQCLVHSPDYVCVDCGYTE